MTRDYKYRAQRPNPDKSAVATWKWVGVGVLVLAFVVFLLGLRTRSLDTQTSESVIKPLSTLLDSSAKSEVDKTSQAADKSEVKEPEESSEPLFEFYTILPGKDEIIPEYEIKKQKRAESLGKPPVNKGGYILQAGSFRDSAQADRVKAQLALLGIPVKIEVATVGTTTWNRVKLGPYPNVSGADRVRAKLRAEGIDAVVLRAKP